jgi:hypothetical protein
MGSDRADVDAFVNRLEQPSEGRRAPIHSEELRIKGIKN